MTTLASKRDASRVRGRAVRPGQLASWLHPAADDRGEVALLRHPLSLGALVYGLVLAPAAAAAARPIASPRGAPQAGRPRRERALHSRTRSAASPAFRYDDSHPELLRLGGQGFELSLHR